MTNRKSRKPVERKLTVDCGVWWLNCYLSSLRVIVPSWTVRAEVKFLQWSNQSRLNSNARNDSRGVHSPQRKRRNRAADSY